ncbi:hypothetical protein M4951_23010 [Blastopirellula sp. J2-11]|uniref:hypothetical protein n=1 Tax=Blastopirellula sp. J2-11 TaxID=2943192 RepID=UPI0021C7151A|nr:hypothetical protein [Blastopirellula sp. J2-11]UUO06213.1 hypothetical protein M4951_23010 [Blastopirellula sp. J2-11]
MKIWLLTSALLLTLLFSNLASAEGWGTIKGKFIVNGATPDPAVLEVEKDKAVCGLKPIYEQNLVVGPKGELKNACVWLTVARGKLYPTAHPMYAATAKDEIDVDNIACVYDPHVTFIRTSQKAKFKNMDPIPHNVKVDGFANAAMNTLIPAMGEFVQSFPEEERTPIPASCSIHPWMSAYLLIRESPYAVVSQADGSFELANVPVGKWTFQFWHTAGGYMSELQMQGKPQKDRRGQYEIEVVDGQVTDLGEIVIAAKNLK